MNDFKRQWFSGVHETEEMIYMRILKYRDWGEFSTIFEVQIPKKITMAHSFDEQVITDQLEALTEVLPNYLKGICDEHNGLSRMAHFPTLSLRNICYTPSCVGLKSSDEKLQIVGCDPDVVGLDFTESFVNGLRGNWQGIDFSGV